MNGKPTKWCQEAFYAQKVLFSVLILPTTHFEQILNENVHALAQLHNITQKVGGDYNILVSYSCGQNATYWMKIIIQFHWVISV
jgi:hypothetical protein